MLICKLCGTQYGEHYTTCPSCNSINAKKLETKRETYVEYDEINGKEVEILTVVMGDCGGID